MNLAKFCPSLIILLILFLSACSSSPPQGPDEPTPVTEPQPEPLDIKLGLSHSSPLVSSAVDSSLLRLIAFSSDEGQFSLVTGDNDDDNAIFRVEGAYLVAAKNLTKESYKIRLAWTRSDSRRASQAFVLTAVSDASFVLHERIGDIGFIGQAAQGFRDKEPERKLSFDTHDTY